MTVDGVFSIEPDLAIGNGGVELDTTGGVDGGVDEKLFLSNGLTRSIWVKFRLVSYLESDSLKTTEELLLYTEDASVVATPVIGFVAPIVPVSKLDELIDVVVASVMVGMVGLFTVADCAAAGNPGALDSLAALPRFLLANSYMSPNIPANVFRRFFMVSSASSATDVCDWAGRGGWFWRDAEDTVDD